MDIIKELIKLVKEYVELEKESSITHGAKRIEQLEKMFSITQRKSEICKLITNKYDINTIEDKILSNFNETTKKEYLLKKASSRRNVIYASANKAGRNDVIALVRKEIDRDKTIDEYLEKNKELDKIASDNKEIISSNYKNVSIMGEFSFDFFKDHIDEIEKSLEEVVDKDASSDLFKNYESFTPINEISYEEIGESRFKEEIDELLSLSLTDEEKEALAYIDKNILVYPESLDKHIESIQESIMLEQKHVFEEYNNKYLETNPKFKNLYKKEATGLFEINSKKETEFKEYKEMGYDFSEATKNAMKSIMHKIDEKEFINKDNIFVSEEGQPKTYAFVGLQNSYNEIEKAIKSKDVKTLPKLVKEYKENKQMMSDIMKLSHDTFSDIPLLYGGNVDVKRNDMMPMEFRQSPKDASLISNLFISLKFCKIFNISIDDFIDNPTKFYDKAYKEVFDKTNVNKVLKEKSLGDALYLMKEGFNKDYKNHWAKVAGILLRSEGSMSSYEKDNDKLLQNSFVYQTNRRLHIDNLNYFAATQNSLLLESEKTILNMAIFGNKKSLFELSANPIYKYDPYDNKKYDMIDTNSFIKNNNLDFKEISKNISNMYFDLQKNYLKSGKFIDENLLNTIKNIPNKIKEIKREVVNDKDFNNLEKLTKSFSQVLDAKDSLKLLKDDKGNLTDNARKNVIACYNIKYNEYNNYSRIQRILSYIPFVNNDIARKRHALNESLDEIKKIGITDDEIVNFNEENLKVLDNEFSKDVINPSTIDYAKETAKIDTNEKLVGHLEEELDLEKHDSLNEGFYIEEEETEKFLEEINS